MRHRGPQRISEATTPTRRTRRGSPAARASTDAVGAPARRPDGRVEGARRIAHQPDRVRRQHIDFGKRGDEPGDLVLDDLGSPPAGIATTGTPKSIASRRGEAERLEAARHHQQPGRGVFLRQRVRVDPAGEAHALPHLRRRFGLPAPPPLQLGAEIRRHAAGDHGAVASRMRDSARSSTPKSSGRASDVVEAPDREQWRVVVRLGPGGDRAGARRRRVVDAVRCHPQARRDRPRRTARARRRRRGDGTMMRSAAASAASCPARLRVLGGAAQRVHLALHDVHRFHRRHAERLAQAGGERPEHAVVDVQQPPAARRARTRGGAEMLEVRHPRARRRRFSVPARRPAAAVRVGRQASKDSTEIVRPSRALALTSSPQTAVDRPPTWRRRYRGSGGGRASEAGERSVAAAAAAFRARRRTTSTNSGAKMRRKNETWRDAELASRAPAPPRACAQPARGRRGGARRPSRRRRAGPDRGRPRRRRGARASYRRRKCPRGKTSWSRRGASGAACTAARRSPSTPR